MGLIESIEKNTVVWFLGALLAAFLAGIGFYDGTLRLTGQTTVYKDELKKDKDRLETLLKKERFLSLLLRVEQKHQLKSREDSQNARKALDKYIEKFIEEADKSESVVGVGKGSSKQTVITFSDGTKWVVPPDYLSAVLK